MRNAPVAGAAQGKASSPLSGLPFGLSERYCSKRRATGIVHFTLARNTSTMALAVRSNSASLSRFVTPARRR